MDRRQPYVEPQLKDFGSVVDLTQVGVTNPGGDTLLQGSVDRPPPHAGAG